MNLIMNKFLVNFPSRAVLSVEIKENCNLK